MSGKEDFGPLVDVLVTCVGAMDVMSVVGLLYSLASQNNSVLPVDINNNNDVKVTAKDKIKHADTRGKDKDVPLLVVDTSKLDDDVIDSLVTKVNELNEKVTELVARSRENSMERFLDAERERYRRSRSPSPFLDQHETDDENESVHSRGSYHRGITRDDEFRKTIKRSSRGSSQHESREEELARLSELEAEEMNNMGDYVPLTYQSDSPIETIEEMPTCPIHGNIDEILASGSDDNKTAADTNTEDAKSQDKDKKIDVNEEFIRMEKAALQSQASTARTLTKQGNVGSEDFPEETVNDIIPPNSENVTNLTKNVENYMTDVKAMEPPRLENFPKTLGISANNDSATDLILTKNTQAIEPSTIEELSTADIEPSPMVRSFAEVLMNNEDQNEIVQDLSPDDRLPVVEIVSEPQSVIGSLMEVNMSSQNYFESDKEVSMSSMQNISLTSSTLDNVEYLNKIDLPIFLKFFYLLKF